MYYYQIMDVNGEIVATSYVPYLSSDYAINAAKDELATIHPSYPVEVRVRDTPDTNVNYWITTPIFAQYEIEQHALGKIREANDAALMGIMTKVEDESAVLHGQYSQGLLTPLEYAKGEESIWTKARTEVEKIWNV